MNRYRSQDAGSGGDGAGDLHDDDRDRRDGRRSVTASPREAQDEYSPRSQQRTRRGATGRPSFDDEIVALPSTMLVTSRETGKETSPKAVTLGKDEGNRPETNLDGLAALKPVFKDAG